MDAWLRRHHADVVAVSVNAAAPEAAAPELRAADPSADGYHDGGC